MLARFELPPAFAQWNRQNRAPAGAHWWDRLVHSRLRRLVWERRMRLPAPIIRAIGPFGFQANSRTRTVEYPWAFFATPLAPGMRAIDVGAGASGFQFLLSRMGIEVHSVDPLINPGPRTDWTFAEPDLARLNRALGGNVVFHRCFLQEADLPDSSVDRVLEISVIEHVPEEALPSLVKTVARLLRPGGRFIATIDLFLDLYPFTERRRNQYGSNVSVRCLVEASGLLLEVGNPAELFGYPEFDPARVASTVRGWFTAGQVASQCIVLRKSEDDGHP